MAEQVEPAPGKPGVTQGIKCRFDDKEQGHGILADAGYMTAFDL
jgi:hypothetical protein